MSVFRELSFEWGGERYYMTPSNKFLRSVEDTCAITPVLQSFADGKPKISQFAFIASEFMRAAGAPVTEDQMYADLLDDMQNNKAEGFRSLSEAIAVAISPSVDTEMPKAAKKPRARAKSKQPA